MSSYRIELANSGRAGCQDTVCKKTQEKIPKGELRLGAWVEIQEHGSWRWRHWGCVSGFTITNIRDAIQQGDDEYRWDMIDGWEELEDHPDIQEKIQRVVKQGHIDPEDFKGDPEFNKPGQKAIRPRATKKTKGQDDEDGSEADKTPKKKQPAKRSRKKAAADDEDDEEEEEKVQPAKKKARAGRKSKTASAVEQEEGENDEDDDEPKAKTKAKAKAPTPAKSRSGRARKKAPTPPVDDGDDDGVDSHAEPEFEPEPESEPEAKPAPKAKGKRGRKPKAAPVADAEEDEEGGDDAAVVEPRPAKKGRGRPRKSNV